MDIQLNKNWLKLKIVMALASDIIFLLENSSEHSAQVGLNNQQRQQLINHHYRLQKINAKKLHVKISQVHLPMCVFHCFVKTNVGCITWITLLSEIARADNS